LDREAIADRIIQDHTFYATLSGSIPLPIFDFAAVTAVQLDLVRALARVYEVPFDVATGKAIIASITGASAARLGASAVKAIPGVGMITGGIAQASLSGASTYAVGHIFREHFHSQGILSNLDPAKSLPAYRELFERGKEKVRTLRTPTPRPVHDKMEMLERLSKLREDEVISANEFEQLKNEALATT